MKLCGKKGTCNSESNNNNTIHQFFAENSNNDVYNIDTDGENIHKVLDNIPITSQS